MNNINNNNSSSNISVEYNPSNNKDFFFSNMITSEGNPYTDRDDDDLTITVDNNNNGNNNDGDNDNNDNNINNVINHNNKETTGITRLNM